MILGVTNSISFVIYSGKVFETIIKYSSISNIPIQQVRIISLYKLCTSGIMLRQIIELRRRRILKLRIILAPNVGILLPR